MKIENKTPIAEEIIRNNPTATACSPVSGTISTVWPRSSAS